MKNPIALVLTCAIALLIAYGTLKPPGSSSDPWILNDKQVHFLAFAFLTLPMGWVRPQAVLWLVPLAICYGGIIELIQPMFGRGAELGDLIADGLGAMTGALPGLIRHSIRN
ncbi:VanZ family protein [Roseovarius sp. EL26]|uniref:VanZ family protein n=1 Tax=Roseovarius sp. EL26 TaxID=2126672 RepID=UPI000EA16A1E|nr:VanZ family protein [Roseovarius sp. EL26]